MNLRDWTIIIAIIFTIYFGIVWIWFRHTLKYKTLNKFIFRAKEDFDFMNYIEMAFIIIMLIGLLTTIYSQIEIFYKKRKGKK